MSFLRRAAITSALITTCTLTGCGEDDKNDETSPSGPTGTITLQASGGDSELQALEDLITAFEAKHPGANVEFVGVAEQDEHIAKLATAFAGDGPPDVFLLNYRRFGQFAEKAVIDPPPSLNPADFFPQPLEAFDFDGDLVCAPQNVSSSVTYYNPELFDEADVPLPEEGWTLEDLTAAAKELAAEDIEAIGFEFGMRTLAPLVWIHGGDVVDDLAEPTQITFDTAEGRATLDYVDTLLKYGVDPEDAAAEPAEDRFARGELAMLLDSRRAVPALRDAGLEFDVAPLPEGAERATLLASDAYCVSAKSGNKDLAHEFVRFAVGTEGGRVLAEAGRTVPSLRSLASDDAFLAPDKQPPSAEVWLDVIPTLRRLPNVGPWNEAETAASDVLEQYFAGNLSQAAAIERISSDSERILGR